MPVTISTHITIEGADVDDAKRQLIALFGVSLGQVVMARDANEEEPERVRLAPLLAPVTVEVGEAIAASVAAAAQPGDADYVSQAAVDQSALTPTRRRRTKAEMAAAPATPLNGAAAASQAEEEIDLLSGGNATGAALTEDDPLADEPPAKPKPAAAATSRALTKADMMEAGKAVLDKHGLQKLTDILKAHGHTRIAALAEHSYPAVMADFEEALA